MSDREEAKSLVQAAVDALHALPELNAGQKSDLEKAVDVLKGW